MMAPIFNQFIDQVTMSNILQAILNIAQYPAKELTARTIGNNRMNNMGEALEAYIQDAFANTFLETEQSARNLKLSATFCYLGNQNNPPDMMLKTGDAIEVKKIQTKGSAIALNSSYPKHKLKVTDAKITAACRQCEDWQEKDIIYAVGVTENTHLKYLWFVYGDCYAASEEIYQRIGDSIKAGVDAIADIEFSQTKELGRVNRVDPLGITNLRIRGMWHIDNPLKLYQEIVAINSEGEFSLVCIMRTEKFNTFDLIDQNNLINHPQIQITEIKIKNPDNPAQLIPAKLIILEQN